LLKKNLEHINVIDTLDVDALKKEKEIKETQDVVDQLKYVKE